MAPPSPVQPADIDTWLQLGGTVDEPAAELAITVAFGWIVGRTSFTAIPDVVPIDLWGAWLELASIGYDNPTMLTSNQAGEQITMWAQGSGARASVILAQLEQNYPRATQQPIGSFPSPFCEGPDPDPSSIVNQFGGPLGSGPAFDHLPWGWWRTP